MTRDKASFQNLNKKDPISVAAVDEASMNKDETEEPLRLLISNGYKICVVDITQPKHSTRSKVEYLKKIATLNLAKERLPVSVGLFRLGSDAYMIGGQAFPTDIKPLFYRNCKPSMYDKYRHFSTHHDVKGTSSDTYCLSIANNGTLSPSKCNNILSLQTPKLWPVVAEIKGKLHVFDSFPDSSCRADRNWKFSHEVMGEGKRSSLTIKPRLHHFIKSHLVLGDNIYALTGDNMRLLFDPIKLKWNSDSGRCDGSLRSRLFLFRNVWDILSYAGEVSSMCVKEIMVGNVSYYVVLSLLIEYGLRCGYGSDDGEREDDEVIVVAFLVTSKGDIVGKQALHNFFRGPIQPLLMKKGAIIKGGGRDGKTMCIALTGHATFNGITRGYSSVFFFSNTFTVELVNNFASNIKHILEASPRYEIAIDGEVVRFHIKDRCVYKLNENDKGLEFSAGMEACFF